MQSSSKCNRYTGVVPAKFRTADNPFVPEFREGSFYKRRRRTSLHPRHKHVVVCVRRLRNLPCVIRQLGFYSIETQLNILKYLTI